MPKVFDWLKDEKNRAVLAWIGGGLAAAIGGFWTVATFFVDYPKEKPSPPTTHVEQKGTGFAAGHDNVINAPVTFNNPDAKEVTAPIVEQIKELTAAQKELAAQTARQKGVEIAPLRAILVKMGEAGIKDDEISKLLDVKADELVKLRAEVDVLQHGSPAVAALAKEAEALINRGDLDGASRVLARGREAARTQRINANRDEATVLALDAQVDDLKLAYRSAAAKYGEAAGLLSGFDPDKQFQLLGQQENELYKQGDEFGDNPALIEAIEVSRRMRIAARDADQRGGALNNLGNALSSLGERESGTGRLEEAVAAYREALKERIRARVPLDWATTQSNLGYALQALGVRENRTQKLEEAVSAYREALRERTRDYDPLAWAQTQNNLGAALYTLGISENRTQKLEEAVSAYREVLGVRTRDRDPLGWAATQNNLGAALQTLGQLGSGTGKLEEAVSAYREVLGVRTRDRDPLGWAATQNNLGAALQTLGQLGSGTGKLEEAVAAFREVLKEYTRDRVPLAWAAVQTNLGYALYKLGVREVSTDRLDEAVAAFGEALKERTHDRVPLDWAITLGDQGVVLMTIAERRKDRVMARTAADQIKMAFTTTREGGHASMAPYYEEALLQAQALVRRLTKH